MTRIYFAFLLFTDKFCSVCFIHYHTTNAGLSCAGCIHLLMVCLPDMMLYCDSTSYNAQFVIMTKLSFPSKVTYLHIWLLLPASCLDATLACVTTCNCSPPFLAKQPTLKDALQWRNKHMPVKMLCKEGNRRQNGGENERDMTHMRTIKI